MESEKLYCNCPCGCVIEDLSDLVDGSPPCRSCWYALTESDLQRNTEQDDNDFF